MIEALPIGISGDDYRHKCLLPIYNKIIEREGGDKITCPNARCRCNKCEKKSCNRYLLCEGVDSPCFLALETVVEYERKEEIDKRFFEVYFIRVDFDTYESDSLNDEYGNFEDWAKVCLGSSNGTFASWSVVLSSSLKDSLLLKKFCQKWQFFKRKGGGLKGFYEGF